MQTLLCGICCYSIHIEDIYYYSPFLSFIVFLASAFSAVLYLDLFEKRRWSLHNTNLVDVILWPSERFTKINENSAMK